MPEAYLELSEDDQKDILQTAAVELGREARVLEKDVWVCWALQTLFSIPNAHPMAFKGGTSLSKVYKIIDRFSEDVDITLDYNKFEDFDPFAKGTSKNQIRKFSDRLKAHVKTYATQVVVPHIKESLKNLPITIEENSIEADDSGEKIWVRFPSVIETKDEYLKSEILIELGGRNVIEPNDSQQVFPDIAELTTDLTYPGGEVIVLSPERTFWEKATLIHVECNRGQFKENADRLSRHWYDLAMLSKHTAGQAAIENQSLFEDVVNHKKVFFNASYANYDACLDNKLQLIPNPDSLNELKSDYEKMIQAGMMHATPPSFAEIIESIRNLEKDMNSK